MPNWTDSMQQNYEYYTVDPNTWGDVKLLKSVKSCTIEWDSESDTLGSATIDLDENVGEVYIRVYLVTIQNGVTEKHPLGTFLVQTQPESFDGRTTTYSVDAYTPLLELKEKLPPIGFFVEEKTNIMESAYMITRENLRAPVVKPTCAEELFRDLVADPRDTWMIYLKDLISNAKYIFALDEMGRVLFSPKQEAAALQPVWTYTDDNSSILYPDVSRDLDLYGIPNVVEVVYSDGTNKGEQLITVKNEDPDSPTSVIKRGREIVHRVTDPNSIGNFSGDNLDAEMKQYAEQLLKELSTIEYTITYTHGYCPVRIGDCIRLNYERAGLTNIKAKVISQSINCTPGCSVTETAVYTSKLCRKVTHYALNE